MKEGPRIIACILFAAVLVVLAVIVSKQHQAIYAMPLVQAAAQPCPKLANPCDTVNCNKPRTKEIA